jgi:hypothetical protein
MLRQDLQRLAMDDRASSKAWVRIFSVSGSKDLQPWSALHDISLAMGGESRQASRTGKSVELSQNNLKESFGSMTRSVRKRTDRMRKSCSALSRHYLYHLLVTVQTSEVASHARRYGGRAESWLSLAATRMGQAPRRALTGALERRGQEKMMAV